MNQAEVIFGMVFVANYDPTVVMQPSEESLNFPSPFVASKLSSVLGFHFPIFFVRRNQFDILFFEGFVEFVGVVGFVADDLLWLFPCESTLDGGLHECNFMRASAFNPD